MKTKQNGRTTSHIAESLLSQIFKSGSAALVLALFLVACGGSASTVEKGVAKVAKAVVAERYASVADDAAGYQKIFHAPPNARQEAQIEENLSKANQQGLTVLRPSSSSMADAFLTAYQTSSADVITVVGHNSKGTFMFNDGTSLQLPRLGQPGRPILALISCDSERYVQGQSVGLPTEVTIPIAYRTEQLFLDRFRTLDDADRRDISVVQAELVAALDEAVRERNVKIATYTLSATGAGVVGVSIYVTNA